MYLNDKLWKWTVKGQQRLIISKPEQNNWILINMHCYGNYDICNKFINKILRQFYYSHNLLPVNAFPDIPSVQDLSDARMAWNKKRKRL